MPPRLAYKMSSSLRGYLEDIPLPNASADVVLSNCVINLAVNTGVVLREAARVLRPGGRFAVTDVTAYTGMDEQTKGNMQQWTECLAGALTEAEYRSALADAGFDSIEVVETHQVHEYAASAIMRAQKPS